MMNECDAGDSVSRKVVAATAAIVTAAVVQRNRGARNHCAELLVVMIIVVPYVQTEQFLNVSMLRINDPASVRVLVLE